MVDKGLISSKNGKRLGVVAVVLAVIFVILFATGVLNFAVTPDREATFKLTSYTDGEDVSWVEISIWIPDKDSDGVSKIVDPDDVYRIANFEEEIQSKKASTVEIDLSDYSCAWVEIDPDNNDVFEQDWVLLSGGRAANKLHTLDVYHFSSDANFNILDQADKDEWALTATDQNVTCIIDFPRWTATEYHAGETGNDAWSIDDDDLDDYSWDDYDQLYDERNWRCQAPIYNPSNDTDKDYIDPLEKLTDAFCIKLTANISISTVDGNAAQINITLTNTHNVNIAIVISATYVYFIFTDAITAPYEFDFMIEFAAAPNIAFSTAQSGRITVPRNGDNLGTFTAYSTIAA